MHILVIGVYPLRSIDGPHISRFDSLLWAAVPCPIYGVQIRRVIGAIGIAWCG